jgi:hypothetical protein
MRNQRGAFQLTLITIGVVLILVCEISPSDSAGMPDLSFGPDRVIAKALTPGTEAVFFGLVTRRNGWIRQYERVDRMVVDEDRDGEVELVWDGDLPHSSIWAVIDSRNGSYAMAVPEEITRREIELSVDDLVPEQGGFVGVLQQQRSYIEVLLSHPGFGVWGLTTGDGAQNDADGIANGAIRVDFDAMLPLHASGRAPHVVPDGAILMVIDPRRMEFGATLVTGAGQSDAASSRQGEELMP